MKKIICLFLAILMTLSLCACGGSNAGNEHAKEVPLRAGEHKLAQQRIMRHERDEENHGDGGAHHIDGLGEAFELQVQG